MPQVSWQVFGGIGMFVLLFGFLPGFVLRLLVRIYPKDDPRRRELVAELYVRGRMERLLFVAEQLETVLFEGLPVRVGSFMRRWLLIDESEDPRVRLYRHAKPFARTALLLGLLMTGVMLLNDWPVGQILLYGALATGLLNIAVAIPAWRALRRTGRQTRPAQRARPSRAGSVPLGGPPGRPRGRRLFG